MAYIKPFRALRPIPEEAYKIAALPYDCYNRAEAALEVRMNPESFLAVDRAETAFGDDVDTYDDVVYQKADELLQKMIKDGLLIQDEEPHYYLYEQTMKGRVQNGIVGIVSVDDYENGTVKKHENTRADKEEDRIRHVDTTSAQTGPIFLAHRHNHTVAEIIASTKEKVEPVYDFTHRDGVRHRVFVISDGRDIDNLSFAFAHVRTLYIADGHHRAASAVKVSKMRREKNRRHTGSEEYNFILSVLFSEEELDIMEYNRVVRDLNWMRPEKICKKIEEVADCLDDDFYALHPRQKGQFAFFVEDHWYLYQFKEELLNDDAVDGLDVSLLQKHILEPIFNIGDPKKDWRIDFVGGVRGTDGLEARCETDCKAGFFMYPTSIQELLRVADEGRLMPPKSTWFEPKLLSGLFIHPIERV